MAIINAFDGSKAKKSSGNKTYRTVQGRLIASEKVTENSSKSIAQVGQRVRFKYASMYAELMKPIIDHSFVKRSRYASSTNAFTAEAVKNALLVPAALKSVTDGGTLKYLFLPQRALISKGNLVSPGSKATIVKDSTSLKIVGGFFSKRESAEQYIKSTGMAVGSMATLIAVVLNGTSLRCELAFARIKCISETELSVVTNAGWDNWFGNMGPWMNTDVFTTNLDPIVACATIYSIDSASGFDCSTEEMVTIELDTLKSLTKFSEVVVMTKEAFASMDSSAQYRWLVAQGYTVDQPLLLDPDSIEGGDEPAPGPVPPTPSEEYSLNIGAQPAVGGTVEGMGYHTAGVPFQIKATANPGYHFVRWSDGDTNATRQIVINEDTIMTAYFEED